MRGVVQDLQQAVRALWRARAFSGAALGVLVIGITAVVTIFAVVNGILLRPLPYRHPERLVGTWHDMPPINLFHTNQSVQTYFTYRTQAHTIDAIGIYKQSAANVSMLGQAADPRRLAIANCTASLFAVLDVPALIGRVFSEEDDRPGAAPVVVISEGMWRAQYGGDPRVIGQQVDVNGVARRIVGVMPYSFRFPSSETALWLPLNLEAANPPGDAFTYGGIARLKAGVTIADAQRDFASVLPRAAELYPKFVPGITMREIMDQTKPKPVLTALSEDVTGGIARTLWLMAIAGLVLFLVACANVGNLALVRFEARRRELAVRAALGAGLSRLIRFYATELSLITALASVLSLGVVEALLRILVTKRPVDIPRLNEVALDGRCIAFALGICVLAVIIFSLVPVLRLRRGALVLSQGTRGASASRHENRVRRSLVAAQMAFALVVLAGSGLLFRTFERLHAVRPGFDADHVVTLWISLPRGRYRAEAEVVRFSSDLLDRTRALPNVIAAGLSSRLPLVARGFDDNPLYPEGATAYDNKLPPLQLFTNVGGDYFRVLGIRLMSGKLFDEMLLQHEGDAIISSRTAQMFWHDSIGRSVIGKRFRVLPTSRWYTVVGVLADAHDSALATPASPTVYFPQLAYSDSAHVHAARTIALAVRTNGDPTALIRPLQRVIHDIDPALPVFDIQPMSAAVRESTSRLRFTILVLGSSALATLLLGAIGLYGVMAYVVSLRRREIGIRLALGATPRGVAGATAAEGMAVAVAGIVVGIMLFALIARFLRALLFGVAPWDPVSIAGASLLLSSMALLASWIPARRAAHVDPAEALRGE